MLNKISNAPLESMNRCNHPPNQSVLFQYNIIVLNQLQQNGAPGWAGPPYSKQLIGS